MAWPFRATRCLIPVATKVHTGWPRERFRLDGAMPVTAPTLIFRRRQSDGTNSKRGTVEAIIVSDRSTVIETSPPLDHRLPVHCEPKTEPGWNVDVLAGMLSHRRQLRAVRGLVRLALLISQHPDGGSRLGELSDLGAG